ncbi:hypothetical protein LCGC14_1964240 [marine sediment metagenome]|uniref:Uncharacterized protein n=1 Tax=marine sediment metagenome TaxID=412755 RepID=A0A0F9G230_9ZZZZ
MSADTTFEGPRIPVRCAQCGQHYQVSSAHAGKTARCRKCGATFQVPPVSPVTAPDQRAATAPQSSQRPSAAAGQGDFCAVCQGPIAAGEPVTNCPNCKAVYHSDCWEYNKGCGLYGCPEAPPTEKLNTLEMPMSYWGKEQKNCPACNREIQAAAIRCRHCGATFRSARPEDKAGFYAHAAVERNLPSVRRGTVWLLVLSIVPCTAPLAAIFGTAWYLRHRHEVRELPALHGALCKLAIGVAVGQSVFGLIVAAAHTMFGG